MPLFHCNNCHHEWEGNTTIRVCDWCGAKGKVIAEKTDLENFLGDLMQGKLDHILKKEDLKTDNPIHGLTKDEIRKAGEEIDKGKPENE